jgi:DNA-binding NarL/FixJ family response regulator
MMPKSKILIVDNHRVVIEGIKSILKEYQEFEVVGEAYDGLHAVELAKSLQTDMIIMDISMAGMDGIETTIQIMRLKPKIKIVIFTMYSNKEHIISLFRAGISAYVLKEDPVEDFILALKAVRGGGTYFSTMAPTILIRHMKELEQETKSKDILERLSAREREVFCLLADGKTVRDIATQLRISTKTVESHKYNIMGKLDAQSIGGLTKIAIKRNLIQV